MILLRLMIRRHDRHPVAGIRYSGKIGRLEMSIPRVVRRCIAGGHRVYGCIHSWISSVLSVHPLRVIVV